MIKQFGLKKFNEEFIKNRTYQIKQKLVCEKIINDLKTKEIIKKKATQLQRREILLEIKKEEQRKQLEQDVKALYSTTISGRQWDKQRRLTYGKNVKNVKRDPVGPLKSYKFDKILALQILKENSNSENDIKNNLKGKWTDMARKVHLEKKGSNKPIKNGAQVGINYKIL